ncbi:phage integrase central domain-containing protein [Ewingella americana]|uniref:phage integrase central domain-containing protein n=1 Tax=Ewingella americana TaxID=41202 RepID=UPI001E4C15DB|nr:site-specific integrase [Ewingella americana]
MSYEKLLLKRYLKPNTRKVGDNQLKTISESMGGLSMADITTKQVANFLNQYVEEGKDSMASALRSFLSDVFREAIADGIITINPIPPNTRPYHHSNA